MSDVWQGPGWWLASDGKWYPAEEGPTERANTERANTEPSPTSATEQAADSEPSAVLTEEPVNPGPTGDEDAADVAGSTADGATITDQTATDETVGVDEAHEPAPPDAGGRGGWTAVEPEIDDPDSKISDDAQWADDRENEPAELPGPRPAPELADLTRSGERTRHQPIERDDAWRKPGEANAAAVENREGAPGVVDVTEASEAVLGPPEEVEAPSPWRGVLLALGFLAAIIGLSILVGLFFTKVVFNDDGDVSTEAPTSTVQSAAPTTATPTTTEETTTTADPALGTEVSVFELQTGDCIEGDIGTGPLERLMRVDCAVPHQYEVYTEDELDSSITEFDTDVINAAAEAICREALDAYVPADDDRNIQFKWFQPTPESWAQEANPDRAITCLLFDPDGPLTGRAA